MSKDVALEESWKIILKDEFDKPYMKELGDFLRSEKAAGKIIYPKGSLIFNALNSTPLNKVKVVILGQDPYHGANQAHGLSFSVQAGIVPPPSLINIYKELKRDLNIDPPNHGCLQSWAEQGVLLLNTSLTVEANKAASHSKQGWQQFTDKVIETVNTYCAHVVFILWGSHAQTKRSLIDPKKHLILCSAHPSPLSAHRGFFGCGHFSKANYFLENHGIKPINWQLPPA